MKHSIIWPLLLCIICIVNLCWGSSPRNDKFGGNWEDTEYIDSFGYCNIYDIDDSLQRAHFPEDTVYPIHYSPSINGLYSHAQRLHYTPTDSSGPIFLIIVANSIYDSLKVDIRTYAEDVHTIYGYGIYIETIENATPQELKALIKVYENNLRGVFLVGDVGECLYETQNDHFKYGYKKWPCDLFFADLNGNWSDSNNNGIYDTHTGRTAPEIFLGRLSGKNMESLGGEVSLIRKQLHKSHLFWWKNSYHTADTVLYYVDRDWANGFSPQYATSILPSGSIEDVRFGIDPFFSKSDYLNRLFSKKYGYTFLACHSDEITHHINEEDIFISQIKHNTSDSYAYNLYCCSACNWTKNTSAGYMGGAYLFNDGKTITVIGSTKIGGMDKSSDFHSMMASKSIGEAFLKWWNEKLGNAYGGYYTWVNYGLTILGDPTIYLKHRVSNICVNDLTLDSFPSENRSNLLMFKAANSIHVSDNFVIPQGVHVIFDAPQITFSPCFSCPLGASMETRSEGCDL